MMWQTSVPSFAAFSTTTSPYHHHHHRPRRASAVESSGVSADGEDPMFPHFMADVPNFVNATFSVRAKADKWARQLYKFRGYFHDQFSESRSRLSFSYQTTPKFAYRKFVERTGIFLQLEALVAILDPLWESPATRQTGGEGGRQGGRGRKEGKQEKKGR